MAMQTKRPAVWVEGFWILMPVCSSQDLRTKTTKHFFGGGGGEEEGFTWNPKD